MSSVELLFRIVIGTLIAAVGGIVIGLAAKGVDRKLHARMQGRVGPPLRQPFYDVLKLFAKDNTVPDNAVGWMFNAAPVICLAGAITLLLYIPFGSILPVLGGHGDLILLLYLLIIPGLAMVVGGFSSGSPYATVGAQREMVTMIGYELPLATAVIAIAAKMNELFPAEPAFALSTIAAHPLWGEMGLLGIIGFAILAMIMVIVTPAELSKIPFDTPEAETELAGGLMVEYSGRNLGLFYLADGVKTVVMGAIIVALFIPHNLSPVFTGIAQGSIGAYMVDFGFFLVKLAAVVFFAVTVLRTAVARLKIAQVVTLYWIPLTMIALLGLILMMWDSVPMLHIAPWLGGA
ncbi:MAG: formate hydrogenlyase subunit 4 [Thermoplasmata archaeon HGW-Thermoplasmata-1]|nr:MAG: formate hydrogenlyase subunit 4 [Thermoplasmata archaeon HGW-Thermoplasmata-1]